MKETAIDELIEIIKDDSHPDREAAIVELLERISIVSKGGDRPTTPPPNP